MCRVSAICLFLAPTALVAQAAPPTMPRESRPVAITRVTVIDVERGQRLPEQTVLTEGNRITALAPAAAVRLPNDARIVDGRGRFLIPGLWDMHAHAVHRWEVAAPLYLANGVLGLREMATALPLGTIVAHRGAVSAGQIAGPRYVSPGPLLAGRDLQLSPPAPLVIVTTADEARRAVDSLARAGADFLKLHSFLSREVFFAIAREARSRGLPFAAHLTNVVSVAEASDSGTRSLEHLRGLEGACSADEEGYLRAQRAAHEAGAPDRDTSRAGREAYLRAINSYSPDKCRALGVLLARNGTWLTPTLVGSTRFRVPRDSLLRDPRLRYVPAVVAGNWRRGLAEAVADSGWVQWQRLRANIVPELEAAGVGLLVGTDANYRQIGVYFGFSVHDEMARFVDAGVTPFAALRAATLNPARYLNATDSLGAVVVGKVADLVLLDADPLVDIGNTRRIHAVLANGRLFDRGALDSLLAAGARAANPRPDAQPHPPKRGKAVPMPTAGRSSNVSAGSLRTQMLREPSNGACC
jgi:imidazolonepropionase-like amidohydrolase